jgi:hypothetical protein
MWDEDDLSGWNGHLVFFSINWKLLEIFVNFFSQVGNRSRVFWNFNFDLIIMNYMKEIFNLQSSPIENN